MNPSELEGTLNWFARKDTRVSSQWVIGRRGEKVRVIPDEWQSWHAGEHNGVAFGIELEQGVETDGFTPVQISALVTICRGYMVDYGIPAVFDPDMTASGFLGHEDSPQGRRVGKSDPGGLFDWPAFLAKLTPQETPYMAAIVNKPQTHENYGFTRYPQPDPMFFKDALDRECFALVHNLSPQAVVVSQEQWDRLTGKS
jgi:N-acetyl-anhydromuramyl-L-alanine amidase AmpD